ncbi:MAG: stage III sporulation protein AE [Clostridia bacterium]|nr:stage III sporulation protein AE [Clostridia bacterium]
MKASVIVISLLCLFVFATPVFAVGENEAQLQAEIEKYDFEAWEKSFSTLPDDIRGMLGESAKDMITEYAQGKENGNAQETLDKIKNTLWFSFNKSVVPITKVLAIGVLSSLASALVESKGKADGQSAVSLLCTGICVLLLLNEIISMITNIRGSLDGLSTFFEISVPVLATLIAAVGNVGTSGMLTPLAAFLNGTVASAFKNIIIPLTFSLAAICVVDAMSEDGSLKHFSKLIKTALKWVIGIVFTVYMGMIAVQGVAAYTADGVAVKSVQFALSESIPVVGSVVSGTLSTVISCALMVKNAAGISAVIIAGAYLLTPLLNIGGMTLALRVGAALCETVADRKICNLLSSLADVCNYLFAAVVSLGLMFMITLGVCIMVGS